MILPRSILLSFSIALVACGGSETEPSPPETTSEAPAPAVAAAPELEAWFEADREEHDFGEVHPDSLQETSFQLVAAGTDDLVVDKVVRSCGCTMGELFVLPEEGEREPVELGTSYAPGTKFELVAKLNTSEKLGVQKQSVRVLLRGRSQPETYWIHADIVPFLIAEPKLLTFGKVSTLEGAQRDMTVRALNGEPFGLSCDRELLAAGIDVELSPIDPGEDGRAESWKVVVHVVKGAPEGELVAKIDLETDVVNTSAVQKNDKSITHHWPYSVKAEVDGVIDVLPDRVSFGTVPVGSEAVRRFVVRCKDPEFNMSTLSMRMENSSPELEQALTFEANEIEPGAAWQVDVRLAGLTRPGPFQGTLAIYVEHPYEERVTVSFRGAVPAPGN